MSLKVLPERKHEDRNFGLEDREGEEELERERGRINAAEREETAIEALQ